MSHLAPVLYSRKLLLLGVGLIALTIVSGAASPALAQSYPKTFKLNYAWSYRDVSQVPNIDQWPQATLKLNRNGSVDGYSEYTGNLTPNIGTWVQRSGRITFTFPSATYTGQRQQDGSYNGTMTNTNGWYGAWKGRFYP